MWHVLYYCTILWHIFWSHHFYHCILLSSLVPDLSKQRIISVYKLRASYWWAQVLGSFWQEATRLGVVFRGGSLIRGGLKLLTNWRLPTSLNWPKTKKSQFHFFTGFGEVISLQFADDIRDLLNIKFWVPSHSTNLL